MKKILTFICLFVFLFPIHSFSQQDYRGIISDDFRHRFDDYQFRIQKDILGPRGLGMGGANIAASADPTAFYFNPASMTTLEGMNFSISSKMNFDSQIHKAPPLSGISVRTTVTPLATLNYANLSYAIPFGQRHLSIGIGYRSFVDMNSKLYSMQYYYGGGRLREDARMNGGLFALSPSVAFDILSSLSVGLTFNSFFNESDFELKMVSPYADKFVYFQYNDKEKYSGSDLDLGLHFRPTKWLFIGAIFSPKWTLTIEETKETLDTYDSITNKRTIISMPDSVLATFNLDIPMDMGLGIALKPFKNTTLALDVRSQEWSKVKATSTLQETSPVLTQLFNTTSWYAGIEQILPSGQNWQIPLRMGFFSRPTPYKDKLFKDSYQGKQIVYNGFCVGLGVKKGDVTIDFAFSRTVDKFGWWMTASDYYNQRMFETTKKYNHVILAFSYKL